MWAVAPLPARRTPRLLRPHPYPPGAPEVTGASGVKGCAPSPLKAPHTSYASRSVLNWLCTAHPYPPGAPHVYCGRTRIRRAHPRLRGRAAQRGAHQAHSKPRTPQGRSYPDCARRTRTRPAHPTLTAGAPLPARRTPRSLPAHPYPPGAPEVTGASGAKGCAPSPARLRAGPALTVQGAPVPAMRTTRSLRVHPYPPGAPHVHCGRTPTRPAHQRLRGRAAQRGAHQASPNHPHLTRHTHPECASTAPVPARRTRGYGGERRKGVRTAPRTTTQVPEMRGCQS